MTKSEKQKRTTTVKMASLSLKVMFIYQTIKSVHKLNWEIVMKTEIDTKCRTIK